MHAGQLREFCDNFQQTLSHIKTAVLPLVEVDNLTRSQDIIDRTYTDVVPFAYQLANAVRGPRRRRRRRSLNCCKLIQGKWKSWSTLADTYPLRSYQTEWLKQCVEWAQLRRSERRTLTCVSTT